MARFDDNFVFNDLTEKQESEQKRIFNINIPFVKGDGSIFEMSTDKFKAIQNNLTALIMTRPGDRPHSEFGSRIIDLMFDPSDSILADDFKEELERATKQWMPYILIDVVNFEQNAEDEHAVNFKINYTVKEDGQEEYLELILKF